MRNRIHALLLGLASIGFATADAQNHIAYPLDNLHGVWGQIIPLGSAAATTNFDEARTQILIPARFLPPIADSIVGLEIAPQLAGVVHYDALTISMGHTTRTTLASMFQVNLPNPTIVYSAAGVSINYTPPTVWFALPVAPFAYDGQRNLVIEIQKSVDPTKAKSTVSHETNAHPARGDLPDPLFAYGPGAFNATSGTLFPANARLVLRLYFRLDATLTIDGQRGGTSTDYFAIGTTATLRVRGNVTDSYALAFDLAVAPPRAIPNINGLLFLAGVNPLVRVAPMVGAVGTVPIAIPPVVALAGTHLHFQAARIDNGSPANVDLTNVVDAIIAN